MMARPIMGSKENSFNQFDVFTDFVLSSFHEYCLQNYFMMKFLLPRSYYIMDFNSTNLAINSSQIKFEKSLYSRNLIYEPSWQYFILEWFNYLPGSYFNSLDFNMILEVKFMFKINAIKDCFINCKD
jgi:hypothetical protein